MKYLATAPVTMPVGAAVKLTEAQQRRCRGLVKPTQDGWSEVTTEMQFKRGEEFETEHTLSKANTVALDEATPVVAVGATPATTPAPAAAPASVAAQAAKAKR